MRRPVSSVSIGGGIWRIKWQPDPGSHILTASMYNGYHVVKDNSATGDCLFRVIQHADLISKWSVKYYNQFINRSQVHVYVQCNRFISLPLNIDTLWVSLPGHLNATLSTNLIK